MTPNRIVAFLTPLVFAPAAGAIAVWAAELGLDIDSSRLEEIFIAGAVIALAPALQWLHGWQKHEEREAIAASTADTADAGVAAPVVFEDDLTAEELALEDEEYAEDEDEDEPGWDEDPLLADEEPVAAGR